MIAPAETIPVQLFSALTRADTNGLGQVQKNFFGMRCEEDFSGIENGGIQHQLSTRWRARYQCAGASSSATAKIVTTE